MTGAIFMASGRVPMTTTVRIHIPRPHLDIKARRHTGNLSLVIGQICFAKLPLAKRTPNHLPTLNITAEA